MRNPEEGVRRALEKGKMVFYLTSSDPFSMELLQVYLERLYQHYGKEHPFTKNMEKTVAAWKDWQAKHDEVMKMPDLTPEEKAEESFFKNQ